MHWLVTGTTANLLFGSLARRSASTALFVSNINRALICAAVIFCGPLSLYTRGICHPLLNHQVQASFLAKISTN
jgi:hypothetical protein